MAVGCRLLSVSNEGSLDLQITLMPCLGMVEVVALNEYEDLVYTWT